jgi:membrane fusion protein (multidrug efflux system)
MSRLNKQKSFKDDVHLILANNQTFDFSGSIETIDGEIDHRTGTISVRCRFPNPDFLLKHGASGKLRLKNEFKSILVIPQKSTFEIQDRIFVYVLDDQNKLKMRQIHIGSRIPHLYVVSKGLKKSDRILYEGIQSASEGLEIKPKFIPLKNIIYQLSKSEKS